MLRKNRRFFLYKKISFAYLHKNKLCLFLYKEDFVFFVRTYRRYVLYKHKTSSYAYFFQRKKYIKKESFPFFLTKISDFGVKDKKIARIFDSLHLLFENLRFSRRETKSREENVPFSLNTREIGSLGSMGAVRAMKLA